MINFFNTRPVRKIIFILSILLFIIVYPYSLASLLPEQYSYWIVGLGISVISIPFFVVISIFLYEIYLWVKEDLPFDWDDTTNMFFDTIDKKINKFLNP